MHTNRDARINTYLLSLPPWQRDICIQARKIIHKADPEIEETIKRNKLPFFTLNGNICAFMSTKDHVNIFIYDPIAPDPEKIINQGEGNKTARAIQIYGKDMLNEKAFLKLIQAIAANNRLGGWRKLKNSSA